MFNIMFRNIYKYGNWTTLKRNRFIRKSWLEDRKVINKPCNKPYNKILKGVKHNGNKHKN